MRRPNRVAYSGERTGSIKIAADCHLYCLEVISKGQTLDELQPSMFRPILTIERFDCSAREFYFDDRKKIGLRVRWQCGVHHQDSRRFVHLELVYGSDIELRVTYLTQDSFVGSNIYKRKANRRGHTSCFGDGTYDNVRVRSPERPAPRRCTVPTTLS